MSGDIRFITSYKMKREKSEMAVQSTAKFVSYDLRPSKQIERKMMLDSFGAAMEAGFSISEYRYVGMGGNRFYDFMLIHKFLGIEKMISLEHDRDMMPRAKFNSPYHFIQLRNENVNNFILGDNFSGNTIYWMDYDGPLHPDITSDVASIAPKVGLDDFIFFTIRAEPPGYLQKENAAKRLSEVKESFGGLAGNVSRDDMNNANFPEAVYKVLHAAFMNAFVGSTGIFWPYFQVGYADGSAMLTYGGVYTTPQKRKDLAGVINKKVPVLKSARKYQIKRFNLTERERGLFDRAATAQGGTKAEEIKELRRLGFKNSELNRYRELLRYHPRYMETLI